MRGAEATHGAERHAVELVALRPVLTHGIGLAAGAQAPVGGGDGADLSRRREVGLQQRRRRSLRVGHVVETERRLVGGQQRRDVHVETEQVADGVGVLGPVQAMERGPAGIGTGAGRGVERPLERRGQGVEDGAIGAARALRRHDPQPQLAHHGFPELGVLRHRREVGAFQAQPAGPRAIVMTADAIIAECLLVGTRAPRQARLRGRLRAHT